LEELGHNVLSAGTPQEALALLNAAPKIDLLFTDVDLTGDREAGLKFRPRQTFNKSEAYGVGGDDKDDRNGASSFHHQLCTYAASGQSYFWGKFYNFRLVCGVRREEGKWECVRNPKSGHC
jgi:hypothetical protein